ncbi:MAG TPA: hypothetical protein VIJ09_05575 [Acidimicrobiales bacterium]
MTLPFTAAIGPDAAQVDITLDRVFDPASGAPYGVPSAPLSGTRWLELKLTVTNIGKVAVPYHEGDPYILSLEWALDPETNQGGYQAEQLPDVSPSCGSYDPTAVGAPLAPGATITGCLAFDVVDGVFARSLSVTLLFAGEEEGDTEGEWLIP